MNSKAITLVAAFICFLLSPSLQIDNKAGKKKDIRDYTDADFEKLYDQWEEDEEELPEDEKPDHLKVRLKECIGQYIHNVGICPLH